MSQIKVNALVSYSGNTVTLGTSGDTINVASGVTFNTASGTLTLPTTIKVDTIQNTNSTNLITQTNVTTITFGATSQTISVPSVASFNSTIGVGGATPSTSGAGITFPSTASASTDANTLDDYEEGTWTPILGGEGTNTGQTYTSQVGRYTKIGNRVYISGYVKLSVLGTLGGTYAAIKGLPFTSNASSSLATGTVSFGYALNFASNVQSLGAYVTTSDTLFYICGSATTGVSPLNNLLKGVIGASTELAFACDYIV